jgi:hypothetical protein
MRTNTTDPNDSRSVSGISNTTNYLLGHHPVKPVTHSSPKGSKSKLETTPTIKIGMTVLESSMACMMSNDGPP